MNPEAVIVGAGPAGSATAIALARAGVRVTVLERARFPRHKVCAEFLGPGTLNEVLRLLPEPPAQLREHPLGGFRISTAGGASFEGRYHPYVATAVSRSMLDSWLAAAAGLAGADVVEGSRVVGIEARDRTWVLRLRDEAGERTIETQAVVAADGLHSVIAQRLRLRRVRRRPSRFALVAHLLLPGTGDTGEMHVRRDAFCGVAPLSGGEEGEANVAVVVEQSEAGQLRGDVEGYYRRTLETFDGLRDRAREATFSREVLATGPMSVTSVPAPPGVFLAGDAAAFLDPFTGQGIGRALRSGSFAAAGVLSWLDGDDDATRTFERRCARAFRGERAVERLIQSFLDRPALLEIAVRRLSRRASMANTLLGVTGDVAPARSVLNPMFFARLFL